jgi:NodT family efflux transporter outer membrane factor (OMF) lipoprotein
MTLKNKLIIYSFCSVLFLLSSCKITQNAEIKNVQIPESYHFKKDSLNSGTLNYRDYFKDEKLIQLIEIGLQNNFDLLEASQNITIAKNRFKIQESKLFPMIGTQLTNGQSRISSYTAEGAGNKNTEIEANQFIPNPLSNYGMGLYTNWEIDIWGKLNNQKKAAFSRYLAQYEFKKWITSAIVAQISSNYYELLALDNELKVIEETLRLEEEALFILKVQKESGKANGLAVKQFEAEISNSISKKFNVLQRKIEIENELNTILGRFKEPIDKTNTSFLDEIIIKINIGKPMDLLLNRPDIKQAEYELLASKCDVKAAQKAFLPSLNISGQIGFQAYKSSLVFSTPESWAYHFIGNLTAPLWNKSSIKSQFSIANSEQMNAYLNYQKKIITAFQEVDSEVNQLINLDQLFQNKKNEVSLLNESILISNELFKSGKANYMEVLMAQRSAFKAKLELIETKKRQFHSKVFLYKTLGGGWQ